MAFKSSERSSGLDAGNETGVAELSDGRLYMTTRHRARIGFPPQPNGRLYSVSDDGGSSWPKSQLDTSLATPVCQASVQRYGESGLLFSNPAHEKSRVRMTIRYSVNDGRSWDAGIVIYPGPSGYSSLGVFGAGDVAVLYERGKLSYSERISFAVVSAKHFTARINR